MVWMAKSVFYNRDLEIEKQKAKWQAALTTALKVSSSGSGSNLQTSIQCEQGGHFKRDYPREIDNLQDPVLSISGIVGRHFSLGAWWNSVHHHLNNDSPGASQKIPCVHSTNWGVLGYYYNWIVQGQLPLRYRSVRFSNPFFPWTQFPK
jgi:hypothetical protein